MTLYCVIKARLICSVLDNAEIKAEHDQNKLAIYFPFWSAWESKTETHTYLK